MDTTHRATRRSNHRSPSSVPASRSRAHANQARGLSAFELAILIVCIVALAAVFVSSFESTLAPEVSTAPVRVEPSQTLWDLAVAHPIDGLTTAQTVEHIKQVNGLRASGLAAGELILVPVPASSNTAVASR